MKGSWSQFYSTVMIKSLLIITLAFCSLFIFDSSVSLIAGIIVSLIPGNINPAFKVSYLTKKLLPLSIIGLGFGMDLQNVIRAGTEGVYFSSTSIFLTLAIGFLLGKLIRLETVMVSLLSVGTAICGGSAIVALGPAIGAKNYQLAVSLGVVFLLNAVALITFPFIGDHLQLTDQQFGIWAAIAIHDTSSVVGAASSVSDQALSMAVPIKLVRALWIIPLVWLVGVVSSKIEKGDSHAKLPKRNFPWFILYFLFTSMLGTYVAQFSEIKIYLYEYAKRGLCLTLFLVGLGISMSDIKKVGGKAFAHALMLWIIVLLVSLAWIIYFGG